MATTMLSAGVPVSVVAGKLGHARSSTTLNVYSHLVDSAQVAADADDKVSLRRSGTQRQRSVRYRHQHGTRDHRRADQIATDGDDQVVGELATLDAP
jgi:hypothetical protein